MFHGYATCSMDVRQVLGAKSLVYGHRTFYGRRTCSMTIEVFRLSVRSSSPPLVRRLSNSACPSAHRVFRLSVSSSSLPLVRQLVESPACPSARRVFCLSVSSSSSAHVRQLVESSACPSAVCLDVGLSVGCLSVCLSGCLSVYLSGCRSVCLSIMEPKMSDFFFPDNFYMVRGSKPQ